MRNLEQQSGELIKTSSYLDTAQAKEQLKDTEGKIAQIKKLPLLFCAVNFQK
ncbi:MULTISPECIES: hypothetical protein [Sphingobacterium]|uniref:Uncharacterized protein n=1 Tax=Sphingobacterium litopenaei TaxID=2763500 RepID=A0ABR7YC34_9SPHI|nr:MULTISPECIES: hypothetical protein [Sphingobacterium]MBD1428872.1 hypothetical protein [Sphingobacterium litopenaei]NGM72819.1 hypothetical protein [Sphingobacterium sp. SGL-16]